MKRNLKRILPIVLAIVVIISIIWYLFVYDTGFTQDMMLKGARFFERHGNHSIATWIYQQAYRQSSNDDDVAIELAEQFKSFGNYTKAEATLSDAIADGGSVELYIALCKTYVEQDKLLDAVVMLDNVTDPAIKSQLDSMRPKAPSVSPEPGFYSKYISVEVAADFGTLYASTDGEYPSVKEDLYKGTIPLKDGENTIYALSISDDNLVSPLAVYGYTVGSVIEPVTLKDNALDELVRKTLGIDPETQLYTSDLWKITSLAIPEKVKDYSDLTHFTSLETLIIENGSFDSMEWLGKMLRLKTLTIWDSVVSSEDLAVIASLPKLEDLTLSGCSIASIDKLEKSPSLKTLNLSNNALRDLTPLSFMATLENLNLSHNALDNLSALSALSGLKVLDVSYNSLASISPLEACTALENINLSHNVIEDLSALQGAASLQVLDASYNKLTDVDILAGCKALKKLNIARNEITGITALSALNKLEDLDFSYNKVLVLPSWSKDCALTTINGSYNKLKSLAPLSGCKNLKNVLMDYNKITSVGSLANCPSLSRVDVYGNKVKDIAKLKGKNITLNYNPV